MIRTRSVIPVLSFALAVAFAAALAAPLGAQTSLGTIRGKLLTSWLSCKCSFEGGCRA